MSYDSPVKTWSDARERVIGAADHITAAARDFSGTMIAATRTLNAVTKLAITAIVVSVAAIVLAIGAMSRG